ncbi:MAG: pseudouridine synthase [Candidatus Bathyarchaeota archaeon]|nr:MAG: pseudouridine synthase [Candidatus Bathyarchaeota archaeon]
MICTNRDPQGRKKAIDIVTSGERIFCVGRLDADTTGIIILTNDSELANRLTHPRYGLAKTYVVRVKGQISGEAVEKLKRGIWLAKGKTARSSVKILRRSHKESLVEISIRQGLKRQIRRMLARVGLPVKSLKRTQIGKLNARGLGVGKFRTLTKAEVAYLKKATIG